VDCELSLGVFIVQAEN